MFRLHQITRRQLCRAGFVLCCLAPLAGLVAWGTYRHLPAHNRHTEAALRDLLGLRIAIGSVAHPRPGVSRYRDVVIADAETGHAVAHLREVEYRTSASDGSARLLLNEITVERDGLAACHALLQRLLRRDRGDVNLSLSAEATKIVTAAGEETVARFSGVVQASDEICEARFTLDSVADAAAVENTEASENRVLLRLARRREAGRAIDEWEMHTGRRSVPCGWLTAITGPVPGLEKSRLQGSVWVKDAAAGQLAIRGRLSDVEMAWLVSPYFGHLVEGKIDIDFARPAHFLAGRIIEMRATVTGGPGNISRSFLVAAAGALGCSPKYEQRLTDGVFPFERVAMEFHIDARGQLAVVGRIPDRPKQLLSDAAGNCLLSEPAVQPQPVVNLVRAIADAEGPTVPATARAATMLARLPLVQSPVATAARARATTGTKSPATRTLR